MATRQEENSGRKVVPQQWWPPGGVYGGMYTPGDWAGRWYHLGDRDESPGYTELLESKYCVAKNRYVIEVHFSRAALFALVDDEIERAHFHLSKNARYWANGSTFFLAPLMQPEVPEAPFATLGQMYLWASSASSMQ